jgi:hypothetical protein
MKYGHSRQGVVLEEPARQGGFFIAQKKGLTPIFHTNSETQAPLREA